MVKTSRSTPLISLPLVILALAGCGGGGPKLYHLSGAVSLDGQPVPYGRIEFVPDTSKGNSGGQGFADIIDGKFDTSQMPGRGVIGGPHKVRITAYESKPAGGGADDTPVPGSEVKPLCIGYVIDADLPAKSGATHDFQLPAEAKGYNDSESATKGRLKSDA